MQILKERNVSLPRNNTFAKTHEYYILTMWLDWQKPPQGSVLPYFQRLKIIFHFSSNSADFYRFSLTPSLSFVPPPSLSFGRVTFRAQLSPLLLRARASSRGGEGREMMLSPFPRLLSLFSPSLFISLLLVGQRESEPSTLSFPLSFPPSLDRAPTFLRRNKRVTNARWR
jgi:hypothetical protein